jgi:hypothetical protein
MPKNEIVVTELETELETNLADAVRRLLRHIPEDAGGWSLGDDVHKATKAMDKAKEWLNKKDNV